VVIAHLQFYMWDAGLSSFSFSFSSITSKGNYMTVNMGIQGDIRSSSLLPY